MNHSLLLLTQNLILLAQLCFYRNRVSVDPNRHGIFLQFFEKSEKNSNHYDLQLRIPEK